MADSERKLVAIVRVRGRLMVSHDIEETMKRLNLSHVNNCTIVRFTDSYKGMLFKCQNYVAYGAIEPKVLEKVLARHAPEDVAKDVLAGKLDSLKDYLPIRLHPPRKGYRPIKRSFKQGGALGNMGPAINGLIERMI